MDPFKSILMGHVFHDPFFYRAVLCSFVGNRKRWIRYARTI
jgi:hypothetical protein